MSHGSHIFCKDKDNYFYSHKKSQKNIKRLHFLSFLRQKRTYFTVKIIICNIIVTRFSIIPHFADASVAYCHPDGGGKCVQTAALGKPATTRRRVGCPTLFGGIRRSLLVLLAYDTVETPNLLGLLGVGLLKLTQTLIYRA